MRKPSLYSRAALPLLVALLLGPVAGAQPTEATDEIPPDVPSVTVDVGVDLVSRFIYRGLNLGEAPQVQPRIALNVENFQVALWSSHPLGQPSDATYDDVARGTNYREVLFWARYDIPLSVGTLTPYVQNHYNPNSGQLFDFDGDGDGAHFFQAQLMFAGNERLPLDAMIGWVFYNDPGDSIYLEAGYRFGVSGVDFRAFAGGVPGESPFNGVTEDEPAVTNVGLTASRALAITEEYELPVGVSFIFNPYTENAFAVFSVSLF
jgi:hypothetical protein